MGLSFSSQLTVQYSSSWFLDTRLVQLGYTFNIAGLHPFVEEEEEEWVVN
jgi:hypothetical protein